MNYWRYNPVYSRDHTNVILMDAKTVKILAVVIVVIVAAAAVVFIMTKDNSSSKSEINAALEVYGNADGDYKIDNADLQIIKKIVNGDEGYTLSKYPMADANYDGSVTQADVDLVTKILKGESCTVYHSWYMTTENPDQRWDTKVVDTKWPIKQCIGNGAANALQMYTMLDLQDNIVAINYSSSSPPDSTLYPAYSKMESLGTSTMYLTASKVTETLAANPGITAVITADNKGYLTSTASGRIDEAGLEAMGIDVIRVRHAAVDPEDYGSALLLLGFLFQKDVNSVVDATKWIENVYKDLDKRLPAESKRVTTAATSSYNYLSARNSDYADTGVYAGGIYTIPANKSTSIKMADNPWLYEDQYQADNIIEIRTGGSNGSWYKEHGLDYDTFLKQTDENFALFKAYQNGHVYLISGDMPVVARVLYSAALLYPDAISTEDVDKIHQEFVDKFLGGTYKVSELKFSYTYEELKEYAEKY